MDENRNHQIAICGGYEMTYKQQKEKARADAIKWQLTAGDRSDSYGEIYKAQQRHEKAAKRFGLVREFRENGII